MFSKSKIKPTLYLSFDIETDGDNPMTNNMISIGFYGVTDNLSSVFGYQANIANLDGHVQNPQTMTFWHQNSQAWEATQINQQNYIDVMSELSNYFEELNKSYTLKFIAMPSCFDWMFFKSYYELANKNSNKEFFPIGFKCQCISSYFDSYCESRHLSSKQKEALKIELMDQDKSTDHFALADAKAQAKLFVKTRNLVKNCQDNMVS